VRIYNGTVPLQRVAIEQCPAKSGFTLLYVGRLAPVKNHPLLLNAFRAALSTMPDLRLWMVGDGSERVKLESLATELGIAEQVAFWGHHVIKVGGIAYVPAARLLTGVACNRN
jgi:glycosyltransferase involved in cell wall biosynthesis